MENCNPDELDALYRAAKSAHTKLATNSPLGISPLKREAEQGTLRYELLNEGLLLYIDRTDQLELKYFLDNGAEFPQIRRTELPILLEELDTNGKREAYISNLFTLLKQQGWNRLGENLQVVVELTDNITNEARDAIHIAQDNGYRIVRAIDKDQAEQVCILWRSLLRQTDVPREHYAFASNSLQHVICVLDSHGKVCAANWWQSCKSTCEVRHTVTSGEHRRRGLGRVVVLASLADATDTGCTRAFTYIDSANIKSLGLYNKMGFRRNGRVCWQFILPPAQTQRLQC